MVAAAFIFLVNCVITGVILRKFVQKHNAIVSHLKDQLAASNITGDKLLTANEQLLLEGASEDQLREVVLKNPHLVDKKVLGEVLKEPSFRDVIVDALTTFAPDYLFITTVEELLSKRSLPHEWSEIGVRTVPVKVGKVTRRCKLRVDMCDRCRMEHRFFVDGGDSSVSNLEGFFIGGNRVDAVDNAAPTCLKR